MSENILQFNLKELQEILAVWQQKPFCAGQIFSWVYKRGVRDFSHMSDLSSGLRQRLKDEFCLGSLETADFCVSRDRTRKLLFRLSDGGLIEAVIIPSARRVTGCVSTQSGCKFSCSFCASGLSGFKRNLSCAEILEQALCLKDEAPDNKLTHIVFMGTGEPLDNYDNVLKAIRIINSPEGLNIGARRITISTCGLVPQIRKLAQESLQIELSVSLHSADDKIRSNVMPVNKKYPLKELICACREYIKKTNRQITFEYVLAEGINSDLQSAAGLVKILRGLNCKINLIPANPVKECCIAPPDKQAALSFKEYLASRGLNVTLRNPRGLDISAACGQLRLKYAAK